MYIHFSVWEIPVLFSSLQSVRMGSRWSRAMVTHVPMPCAPQMTLPCVDLTTVAAALLSGLLVILPYYAMVRITIASIMLIQLGTEGSERCPDFMA